MWKIFVMGPFLISLTFIVLLKNHKEKICRHFLIVGTCKKGTGSQNTYLLL